MNIDRQFFVAALGYAVIGLMLGIYMAASHDHVHRVTHAHILLIGFVVSFAYSIIYKLWIIKPATLLSRIQFAIHQLGAGILLIGLFLLYGNYVPESIIGPIMGMASISVLIGMLLMIVAVLKRGDASAAA